MTNWQYLFALLGRCYHLSPESVLNLTMTQVSMYLSNLPYVLEWSDKFGETPMLQTPMAEFITWVKQVGIKVPGAVEAALLSK